MILINELPNTTLQLVTEYLLNNERLAFFLINQSILELRRSNCHIILSLEESIFYYNHQTLPERYLKVVSDPSKQITFQLSTNKDNRCYLFDFSRVQGVNHVRIEGNYDVFCGLSSFQSHGKSLHLQLNSKIIHHLSNFNHLQRFQCDFYSGDFHSLSPISSVPEIIIRGSPNLLKTAPLCGKTQKFVDLSYCYYLTDVSTLRDVHTVILSHCSALKSVKRLGKNFSLDLSYSSCITDISSLSEVIHLNINGLDQVRDVSMLHAVRTLKIERCSSIQSLTGLHKLRVITLFQSLKDKLLPDDVNSLPQLRKIQVTHPRGISSFPARSSYPPVIAQYDNPAEEYETMRIYLSRDTKRKEVVLTSSLPSFKD